jgi:3' terminal RNA ribose 2'-O-methyltransferase Hen1
MALDRMEDSVCGAVEETLDEAGVANLNARRLEAVVTILRERGARSVIDLGCGEGNLLRLLLKDRAFERIAGTDVSRAALERAARRLNFDEMSDAERKRLVLFQGSLTYRDERFGGYDAATCTEVLEHIDLNRLSAFADVVFGEARPGIVVLTTPNVEYNEKFGRLDGGLRHGDHRFEWTRERFREWGDSIAGKYGYFATYSEIGDMDEDLGAQTQMGVFELCG